MWNNNKVSEAFSSLASPLAQYFEQTDADRNLIVQAQLVLSKSIELRNTTRTRMPFFEKQNGYQLQFMHSIRVPTGVRGSPNPSSHCPLPLSWTVGGNAHQHPQCDDFASVTTWKWCHHAG